MFYVNSTLSFAASQVVGVAFQNMVDADNIGYIIPGEFLILT